MELIDELQELFDKTHQSLVRSISKHSDKVEDDKKTNLAKFVILLRLSILEHPHEPNPNLEKTLVLWSEFCEKSLNNFRWDTVVHFTVSPNNVLLELPNNLPELENYDLGYIDYYKYLGARLNPLPYPDNANKFDELLNVDLAVEDFKVGVIYLNHNLQVYSRYVDYNYIFLREYTSSDTLSVTYLEPESYPKALKDLSSSIEHNYREVSTAELYSSLSCFLKHHIVYPAYRTPIGLRLVGSDGGSVRKVLVGVYEIAKVIKLFVNTAIRFAYFNLGTDSSSNTFVTISNNKRVEDSTLVAVLPTINTPKQDSFKVYLKPL